MGEALGHLTEGRHPEVVGLEAGRRLHRPGSHAPERVLRSGPGLVAPQPGHEPVGVVEGLYLGQGQLGHRTRDLGGAVDGVVVLDDQHAVGGELHVQFEDVGTSRRRLGVRVDS